MLSCRACAGLESALRASQMAKSPGSHLGSTSSPGSPTGKLVRSRQQNEHLKAEIHTLREAFEDIDGRNQALREEKQEVARRLDDVQSRLHRETEGLFQQSAHSKSLTQQLQVYLIKSLLACAANCSVCPFHSCVETLRSWANDATRTALRGSH